VERVQCFDSGVIGLQVLAEEQSVGRLADHLHLFSVQRGALGVADRLHHAAVCVCAI
jgi:hypothetical protein